MGDSGASSFRSQLPPRGEALLGISGIPQRDAPSWGGLAAARMRLLGTERGPESSTATLALVSSNSSVTRYDCQKVEEKGAQTS